MLIRIEKNAVDFYLINLEYLDHEYISFLSYLEKFWDDKSYKKYLNILKKNSSPTSVLPLVQKLQQLILKEKYLTPLFFKKYKKYYISKSIDNYRNRYLIDEQIKYELLPFEYWVKGEK